MKRITSHADEFRDIERYELPDGRCIAFEARDVEKYGLNNMLRRAGLGEHVSTDRLPVIQCGQMIGTVPPDFDPRHIKTKSLLLYRPRPGDFVREGRRWIAAASLGPGDFELIEGLVLG